MPAFKMKRVAMPYDLDALLTALPSLYQQYDRLQWYWTPYTTDATLLLRIPVPVDTPITGTRTSRTVLPTSTAGIRVRGVGVVLPLMLHSRRIPTRRQCAGADADAIRRGGAVRRCCCTRRVAVAWGGAAGSLSRLLHVVAGRRSAVSLLLRSLCSEVFQGGCCGRNRVKRSFSISGEECFCRRSCRYSSRSSRSSYRTTTTAAAAAARTAQTCFWIDDVIIITLSAP